MLNALSSSRFSPEDPLTQFTSFTGRQSATPRLSRAPGGFPSGDRRSEPSEDQPDFPDGGPEGDPDGNDPDGDDPGDDDPDDHPGNVDHDPVHEVDQVFQNLATAINNLARVSQRDPGSGSSTRTKLREPDQFDGTDPKKLRTFLIQCELNFRDRPRAFSTDRAKVTFAQSFLKGMALEWFEPDLLESIHAYEPLWMSSWKEFVIELQSTFGPHDPVADAESQLDNLQMKDTHRINRYVVEFNRVASQVRGYGNGALRHHFYTGLPDCIKDEICRIGKPGTLQEMRHLAQEIDARYWERREEQQRANKGQSSSNKSTTTPATSSTKSGQDSKSKSTTSGSTATPSKAPAKSDAVNSKLGKDGKLTPEAPLVVVFDQI